jgi:hypothetical protein
MKQLLVVKKTTIDQGLKVNVTLEFTATGPESQANLFDLIRLQGLPATIEVTPFEPQEELPFGD